MSSDFVPFSYHTARFLITSVFVQAQGALQDLKIKNCRQKIRDFLKKYSSD